MKLPSDTEAERAVLGSMMLDPKAVDEATSSLASGDFYDPRHREVFDAMCALSAGSQPIDEVSVGGAVKFADAKTYLTETTEWTPTAVNVGHYIRVVREKSSRRAIIEAAREAIDLAMTSEDEPAAIADTAAAALAQAVAGQNEVVAIHVKDLLRAEVRRMERAKDGEVQRGWLTGFYDLDQILGGLQGGNLIIVAGRPSMGKSALADAIARGVAGNGATVLAFNLEMGEGEIVQRMLASDGRVDLNRIRYGELRDADWVRTFNAASRLHPLKYAVAARSDLSILKLRADARRWKAKHGSLDLIVVDYLQLMTGERRDNREREVAEISRGLKALAMEMRIPVIALSQLNRGLEQRKDKRPMLSDLRESGALEQDANAVIFVYRDDYYNPNTDEKGVAEISVSKNRNGPTGIVKLLWKPEFTRFDNMQSS